MANKKRKCKQCKQFIPADQGVKINTGFFCNIESAMIYAREKASKKKLADQAKSDRAERAELKKRKQALKSKSEWLKEAQAAFNRWVRLRDKGLPCISCGNTRGDNDLLTGSRIDAGHYRSVGSCPELRFEPLNCNAQCVKCNRNLSGNAVDYRIGLIKKIGQEGVDYLEGPHEPKKYTIDQIKDIKDHYAKLGNDLQKTLN